jgi:transposase-like protein
MPERRRKYTPEFKDEAVRAVIGGVAMLDEDFRLVAVADDFLHHQRFGRPRQLTPSRHSPARAAPVPHDVLVTLDTQQLDNAIHPERFLAGDQPPRSLADLLGVLARFRH